MTAIGLTTNRRGIYKFRVKVSICAIRYFNRKEINKSLNTKDLIIATSKATFIYNEYQRILKVIKMGVLSNEQIQDIVDKYIIDTLEQDKIQRATNGFGTVYALGGLSTPFKDDAEASRDVLSELISTYKEELSNSNYQAVEASAIELLSLLGYTYDKDETSHQLLLQRLLIGQIEIFEEAYNRYLGKYNSKYDSLPPIIKVIKKDKKKYETYQEAYEFFKKQYDTQNISSGTKKDTYSVLERFLIIVGNDSLVANTDLSDLIDIKEQIQNLPTSNLKAYKDLSFEQLLNLSNIPREDLLSDSRTNDYIKHIKKFFSFCFKHQIISFNPATSDLNISVKNDSKDPFTDEEINNLIKLIQEMKDDRKYLLICYIYSGMRREELFNCSIETSEDGIQYFDIKEGKNSSSIRRIPLHNKIIEFGVTADNLIKAKAITSHTSLGRFFNQSIKPQVTISKKKTLHSFRHTFATKLQALNVTDNVIKVIIGHSAQDTLNKVYARDSSSLKILKESIDRLSY